MARPPKPDRRRLLRTLGLGAVALAPPRGRTVAGAEPSGAAARAPSAQASGARPGNPIAVSRYSYWRFRADSMLKIEDCLRLAAETGFDGIEILEKQMHRKDRPHVAVPHGGHNIFLKDRSGQWWATFFGNDPRAPFRERPAILQIEFGPDGRVRPKMP